MTFFGPSMTEKTVVEARARKISGEFPVTVGGRGPSDARFSRTYVRVCEALALTEPERLHCRLLVTQPVRPIDPLMLIEPE